jgi:voltage-gated potassium channel
MYYAEKAVQPEDFSSIPQAMWWSIITLTTVGYGDVSPVTGIGKLIGAATALLGVCTLALLTGVVANSFAAQMSRRRAIFEAAIRKAIENGKLSSQERAVLDQLQDEYNLTREHADAIFQKCVSESTYSHIMRSSEKG